MLKVTATAQKEFDNYFKGKEIKPVRIFLANQGCGGPSIGLAVDELKEDDMSYDIGDIKYVIVYISHLNHIFFELTILYIVSWFKGYIDI